MYKFFRFFLIASIVLCVLESEGQVPSPTSQPATDIKQNSIPPADILTKDSSVADTLSSKKEKVGLFKSIGRSKFVSSILDNKYPNPNRAAAMSFILPGSGQVYNKKAWKLPIVYGALGGLGLSLIHI